MVKITFALPLLCAMVTAFQPVFAQTPFVKDYPEVYSLVKVWQSSQSGYMAVGNDANTGFFVLFGLDGQGDTLWTKKHPIYNSLTNIYSVSAAAASDGGCFVLYGSREDLGYGTSCSFNSVMRTNAQGDSIWNVVISSTDAWAGASLSYLSATPDGGCVVVGGSSPGGNFRIVKVDSTGKMSWSSVDTGIGIPNFQSVGVSSDGGYIATGFNNGYSNGAVNLKVVKFNSVGESVWTRTFYSGLPNSGDGKQAQGLSVVATSDGGCLLAGYVSDSGATGGSALLMRMNGSGDSLWTKTYYHSSSAANPPKVYGLLQIASGQYLMFLDQNSGSSDARPTLVKINASGDTLWSQSGYPYTMMMSGIDQAGEVLLTGYYPAAFIRTTAGGLYMSPVPMGPDNASVNVALGPNLSWRSGGNQIVSSYRVQVASDSLFTKVAFDSSNVTRDTVQTGQLLASTRYFWRVQSFGKEGGPTQWSDAWSLTTGATFVKNTANNAPILFSLELNFPHPSSQGAAIRYSIPRASHVTLRVFNTLGLEVAQLVNRNLQPGRYEVQWNANGLGNGAYFFRLASGESVSTKRLTLSR